MTFNEVMEFLESKGSEQTRRIYGNHGAPDNLFGVKVADMKVVQKKVKTNHDLAVELFNSGNGDAQYLAGLIADPRQFSKEDFETWALASTWYMVSEYAVAWNLGEHPDCIEICDEWIHSNNPKLQQAAWASLSSYMGVVPNDQIDVDYHRRLMEKVENEIHDAENRVRYTMNGYIIALGGAIPELTQACKDLGERIGKVEVFMGKTSCKVPEIKPYIEKMEARNRIGKKRKTAKC